MPGQRVREVRALRNAYAESTPDSGIVSTQRDWLRGDTIVAYFDSVATADTANRPRIRQIVSEGNARSFYQMKNSRGPATEPTVNYVRGKTIQIDFADKRVATVTVLEKATGVLIEPAAASADAGSATTTQPRTNTRPPATPTTPIKPPPQRPR